MNIDMNFDIIFLVKGYMSQDKYNTMSIFPRKVCFRHAVKQTNLGRDILPKITEENYSFNRCDECDGLKEIKKEWY